MKKIILSVIVVFSILAPALVFTHTAKATTCPVKMPETLLSLYRNSEAIYIGRFTGSEEGPEKREDEHYFISEIKKNFDISSTLKGKAVKTFTLHDTRSRYVSDQVQPDTVEAVVEEPEAVADGIEDDEAEDIEDYSYSPYRELTPGDDVLLFLNKGEDVNHLELTDYRDGIKNLSAKDIAVYESRIKELNHIFAAEKPDPEKITDWLVKCAEDPVTRWEGTYELERSFQAVEYKEQRDADRKERADKGEKVEEDKYFDTDLETGRTTSFAKLLNPYHKQTLANILLNSEFQAPTKKPGKVGFVRGDTELMGLVSRWADTRVAELFLTRLRSGMYSPRESTEMMDTVAGILGDDKLSDIAENFSDVYYEKDSDEVDESYLPETEETSKEESSTEPKVEETTKEKVEPPVDQPVEKKAEEAKETEKAKRPVLTYKEFRADLLMKFIQRADLVIANPQAKNVDDKQKEER